MVPLPVSQFASTLQSSEIVTLLANDGKRFCVQRHLLEKVRSQFTTPSKMNNPTWRFDRTDSETLQYFLYWLFHGNIPFVDYDVDDEYIGDVEYLAAARLWIFGEGYHIPKLQNIAMSRLHVCKSLNDFAPNLIDEVFDKTSSGSALQRFLAHEAGLTWRAPDLGHYEDLLTLVIEEFQQRCEKEPAEAADFMVDEDE